MQKLFISNGSEPARLFKNDFLDKFSRAHFSMPLIIYIPILIFLFYEAFFIKNMHLLPFVACSISGMVFWTFLEYLAHRFIYHFPAKNGFQRRLQYIIHGVHHDYPNDPARLVTGPLISLPFLVLFYWILRVFLSLDIIIPFFCGFILAFIAYDMTHFAVHTCNFSNKIFRFLKRHHMRHHYQNPEHSFGLTSGIWDYIFKTSERTNTGTGEKGE